MGRREDENPAGARRFAGHLLKTSFLKQTPWLALAPTPVLALKKISSVSGSVRLVSQCRAAEAGTKGGCGGVRRGHFGHILRQKARGQIEAEVGAGRGPSDLGVLRGELAFLLAAGFKVLDSHPRVAPWTRQMDGSNCALLPGQNCDCPSHYPLPPIRPRTLILPAPGLLGTPGLPLG